MSSIAVDAAARGGGCSRETFAEMLGIYLKTQADLDAAAAAPEATAVKEQVGAAGNARPAVEVPAASRARTDKPDGQGGAGGSQ